MEFPYELPQPATTVDPSVLTQDNEQTTAMGTAVEAGAFTVLRGASNALWIGGAVLSNVARIKYDIGPEITMPTIGAVVTGIEYAGTSQALKVFDKAGQTADIDTQEYDRDHKKRRVAKELTALAYVAWNGAMSGVKVNNSLGLDSTKKRRLTQSAVYGSCVSLYSIPILGDGVVAGAKLAWEHPAEAVGTTTVGGLAVFGLVKGIQSIRHRLIKRRESKSQVPALNLTDLSNEAFDE